MDDWTGGRQDRFEISADHGSELAKGIADILVDLNRRLDAQEPGVNELGTGP